MHIRRGCSASPDIFLLLRIHQSIPPVAAIACLGVKSWETWWITSDARNDTPGMFSRVSGGREVWYG